MIPSTSRPFDGVYAATVCPMRDDFAIDEPALAAHLARASEPDGIVGVLCNGHAGENFVLGREEKRKVVEVARAAVGDTGIVVSGVNAECTLEAVEHARDAERAGADAVMVFAPNSWASPKPASVVLGHHRMIVDAVSLPVMLFQASVNAGDMAYPDDVLESLVGLPRVVAIKEGSWEVAAYESTRRLVRRIAPGVAVMGSGDEHLLTSFLVGSEGSIVSLAALVPEIVADLYRASVTGDWGRARELHETIYPLSRAIYGAPPGVLATARLKVCLALLGHIPSATVRPPMGPLDATETGRLRAVLEQVRLA